jgi:ketosteroid isomerase-like protein
MNRRRLISMTGAGLIASGLALLSGSEIAAAQPSDTDQVKATIESFKAALSNLDAKKMDALWAHDPNVMLVNPRDKAVSIGWDAVSKDWEATFALLSQLNVTQKDGPYIQIKGNVAWATGVALETGKLKTGNAIPDTPIMESNVFEKRGDHWLIVSHSAWFAPK